MEFTIIKNRAMTLSRSPQFRAFSWVEIEEKSLSPLFSIGGWGSSYKLIGALCLFSY